MNKNKKKSILHRNEVFYTLGCVLIAIGAYIAHVIEDRYKVVAGGILGLAVPYLIYLAFLSPKNTTSKPVELEDLEFPRDIISLFFGQ